MTKEKEVLANIIELYKNMPFLWDKSHKDYKNKFVRNNGYKVLFEVYKKLDRDATVKTMVKKVQNLRSNYLKESKKVKESLNKDGEIYVPTLWYYNAMSFIEHPSDPNNVDIIYFDNSDAQFDSVEYLETEDGSASVSESETIQRSDSFSSTLPSLKKKRFNRKSLQTNYKIKTNHEDFYHQSSGPKSETNENEWEMIGKSIGYQLRDLNKEQFYIAQKIMHDTLYYAQMGMLNEESHVAGVNKKLEDKVPT